MDIGNQQRVIIVEPDRTEELVEEPEIVQETRKEYELVGEWPLPMAIDSDAGVAR